MGRLSIHVARLFLGVCFLVFGGTNIFGGDFLARGHLAGWAQKQIAGGHVFPFYRTFLETVVIPNDHAFAILVAFAEFTLGIALVAGVFLGPAGVIGIVLIAAIGFASAAPPAGAGVSTALASTLTFASIMLLLLVISSSAEAKRAGAPSRGKKRDKD